MNIIMYSADLIFTSHHRAHLQTLTSALLILAVLVPCSVCEAAQAHSVWHPFGVHYSTACISHMTFAAGYTESRTKAELAEAKNSHFVGRSSFRLPRFLCGIVRLSSLSFSESCSSWLGRNPFSWEGLRLWPWGLSSTRQEEGLLGIPFSTSLSSCLRKQASDVLALCPPMSPLWTSAMDGLPTPVQLLTPTPSLKEPQLSTCTQGEEEAEIWTS